MKHLSRIEIVTPGVPGNRGDRVVLDGHDITRSVVAHQVSAQLGRITEVYLTLHVADASTHGAAAVFMDPSTAALLQRHGWTPPEGDELLLTAHECELEQLRAEVEHLKVERGEALLWSPWNAHDVLFEQWAKRRAAAGTTAAQGGPDPAAALAEHECVPTQDAYNRACAALWKHRGRAGALAAAASEVAGFAEQVGYSVPEASPVKTALLGLATRLRDALRVDEAALKDQPHPHRASGGPVPAGQTVIIGPGDCLALTCSMCTKPMAANGVCSNTGQCPQAAVIHG